MTSPSVSVYVANFNYGAYLQQAVDSVLAQDYPSVEIIVIDDASTDSSADILRELERHPRIRVIRQPANVGLTATCNTAIRASSGEFVMRLDADDYLEPTAVSTMVKALIADPGAVLAFPDYAEVDARGTLIRRVQRHDFNALDAMSDLPAHGACTLVRRNFLDSMGGYDESISRQDGLDLWLNVGAGQRVAHIGEPLFHYRHHGRNLTGDEGALLGARARLIAKHVAKRGLPRPRVLAVVPVRGQCIDPASRPLDLLGGRPLIDWTVEAALSCAGIDRVVVSSPDPAVLDYIESRHGGNVGVDHRRPEWAGINVALDATLQNILEAESEAGRRYDAQIALTIESPFRSSMFIQQAIDVMQLFDTDEVVGVRRDDGVFHLHDGLGLTPLRKDDKLRREREDLFRQCGGMHLVRLRPSCPSSRVGHVLIDRIAAFPINADWDWKIAETLAARCEGSAVER